jgi:hypothetical protein
MKSLIITALACCIFRVVCGTFLNIESIKKNTEILIDSIKEVGIEINVEKTKYMLLSRQPECRSKSGHKNSKQLVWKCITVQIFVDNSNKSKFDSGGN